jgi:exonuclease SbcD
LSARLLFVGDMHLGRRPSRLPLDSGGYSIGAAELMPAAAWRACVELALRERVDAVALAGDVVDSSEDRFEAYPDLKAGVAALIEAGIPVYGVAGNHDVEALPRLAEQIPSFRLIGARGRWECVDVTTRSGTPVRLLGWSFPSARVRENPLDDLSHESQAGVATLGLLHCDLDGGQSVYAPTPRSALLAAPADAWLLGHIHKPHDLSSESRPIGYLGSLMGLDPGEHGRRGPWLVEVDGPGAVHASQVPLAPLRWERVRVSVDGLEAEAEDVLEEAFFACLRRGLAEVRDRLSAELDPASGLSALRAVGARLELVGRCRGHHRLRGLLTRREQWPREIWDGVHYFVEKIEDRAGPVLDLERLAAGDDPPALLARRVLLLQAGGEAAADLVERAAEEIARGLSAPRWQRVEASAATGDGLREVLLRAAFSRLEGLLSQREPNSSAASDRVPA